MASMRVYVYVVLVLQRNLYVLAASKSYKAFWLDPTMLEVNNDFDLTHARTKLACSQSCIDAGSDCTAFHFDDGSGMCNIGVLNSSANVRVLRENHGGIRVLVEGDAAEIASLPFYQITTHIACFAWDLNIYDYAMSGLSQITESLDLGSIPSGKTVRPNIGIWFQDAFWLFGFGVKDNEVYKKSPRAKHWTFVGETANNYHEPLTPKQIFARVAHFDNLLWLAYEGNSEIYENGRFVTGPTLPSNGRSMAFVALSDVEVLYAGGYSGATYSGSHVYNFEYGNWTDTNDIPSSAFDMWCARTTVMTRPSVLCAGYQKEFQVLRFDIETRMWQSEDLSWNLNLAGRHAHNLATFNDQFVVIGKQDYPQYYDASTVNEPNWTTLEDMVMDKSSVFIAYPIRYYSSDNGGYIMGRMD